MRSASEIQIDIQTLPKQEYIKLAQWFSEYDGKAWDKEIIKDSQSGRLDFLVDEALTEKNNGKLKEI